MALFTFKSDLNGDKRRFKFEASASVSSGFAALKEKLESMYDVGELVIKYVDDENDLITLLTDEDLAEALTMHPQPIKLTVYPKSAPPPLQQPEHESASPATSRALPEVMLPEIMRQQLWFMKQFKKQAKSPVHQGAAKGEQANHAKLGNPVKQMARFVKHVTLLEGEQVPAGEKRKKVWRVRNDSPNAWPAGSHLIYVSGKSADQLSTADSFPVAVVLAPGEEADIEVEVVAPTKPGFYQGFWRLQGPKGRKFGQRLGCGLQVSETGDAIISSTDESAAEEDSDGFVDVGDHPAKTKKSKVEVGVLKGKKEKKKLSQPNPADPASADLWVPERAELRARGFTNEGLLLKMLWKCDGDLEAAAAKLTDKRNKLEGKVHKVLAKIATLTTAPDPTSLPADAASIPVGKE